MMSKLLCGVVAALAVTSSAATPATNNLRANSFLQVSAPKTYKVSPGEQGGLKIEPAPGQNDPEVHTRPRADYAEQVKQTAKYLGDHSYKDDIRELLKEVDRSENTEKGLKLRVVEKEVHKDRALIGSSPPPSHYQYTLSHHQPAAVSACR